MKKARISYFFGVIIGLFSTVFGINSIQAQSSVATINFQVEAIGESTLGTVTPTQAKISIGKTLSLAGNIIVVPTDKNYELSYWIRQSDSAKFLPADLKNQIVSASDTYLAKMAKKSYIDGENQEIIDESSDKPILEMAKNVIATSNPHEFIITLNVNAKKEIPQAVPAGSSVVFLIDASHYMEYLIDGKGGKRRRIDALKEAAKIFTEKFFAEGSSEKNEIAVVQYDTYTSNLQEFSANNGKTLTQKKEATFKAIDAIKVGNGQRMHEGFNAARKELENAKNAEKYIILFASGREIKPEAKDFRILLTDTSYKGAKGELTNEILSYEALGITPIASTAPTAISSSYDYRITEFDYTLLGTNPRIYDLPLSNGDKRTTLSKFDSEVIGLISEGVITRKSGTKIYSVFSYADDGSDDFRKAKYTMINIAGSSDKFYLANDTDKLAEDFEKIYEEMSKEVKLWEIKDPMSEFVNFSHFLDDDGNPLIDVNGKAITPDFITWNGNAFVLNLSHPNVTPKIGNSKDFPYCYSTSYVVKLMPNEISGFDKNKYYPTNGITTLSYTIDNGPLKNANYQVPQISGSKEIGNIQYNGGEIRVTYGDQFLGKTVATAVIDGSKVITYKLMEAQNLPAGLILNSDGTITGKPLGFIPSNGHSFGVVATSDNGGEADAIWTIIIEKAILTITATNASKTFGTELVLDGKTGFTAAGFKNGETIGSVTLTSTGSPVSAKQGTHDIIASNATGGTFNSNNYAISYAKGTLTVSAKSINPEVSTDISVEKIASVTYSGFNQDLKPVIKDGEKILVEEADYELSYSENTKDVGEVTVTITGKGNYSGTTTTTYNITKAILTITATDIYKVYGTKLVLDNTKGFTSDGLKGEETIGSVVFSDYGTLADTEPGEYELFVNGATGGTGGTFNSNNYQISYKAGFIYISMKNISPEVSTDILVEEIASVTYNGLNQDLKPVIKDGEKILVEGKDYTLSYSTDTKNVGEVTVTITGKGNYNKSTTTTYNITPATLTITATNASKAFGTELIFDGTKGFTAVGLQNNETIGSVTLTSAGSLVSAKQGTHDIIASDATGGTFNSNNYAISYVKGTLTVSAKSINPEVSTDISVEKIASVTYSGFNQDLKPVIADGGKTLVEGTDYELSYSEDTKNVGEVTVTITGKGNYSGTTTTTYNITPATLTITATNASKTFGTELIFDGTKGFSAVGLQNTETIGSVTLTSAGSLVSAEQGTHDIIASNAIDGTFNSKNYAISYVKGTLTVSAKSINPEVSTDISVEKIASATYNGLNQDLKPVIKDGGKILVEGTDYTLSYSTDTKNVGEVTVTITGKGNYSGTTTTTYNIIPATLTITATPASKTFGTELVLDGTKGFSAVGLQNNETIGSVTLTSAGSPVSAEQGTHDIIASDAIDGTFNSKNYAISYAKGTLTVSAKSISPEVSTDISVEKIASATYNGLNQDLKPVIKDGETLVEGKDYTLSYSTDTKNVGEVTVTITGKGNYSGTTTTTYNITPATLTITATNASKTFGTELVLDGTKGFSAVGLQNNETIGSVTLTSAGSPVSAEQGTHDIIASNATGGTFNSNNYAISYVKGTLTVSAKSISPEVSTDISVEKITSATYNGLNQDLKPVIEDGGKILVEGTDYELSYSEDTKNVGEVTVTITGKGNYSGTTTTTYNITPATLTITATPASKAFGTELIFDGAKGFTAAGLQNNETIGSVTLTSAGSLVSAEQGTHDIIASNAIDGTFNSKNYAISYVKGTLTVSAKSISPEVSTDISVEKIASATYNGLNQDLKPVIEDGGKILVEGTDYELSYSEDTKNVGEVTVTITGKGNYSGTTTTTYNITPATLTITATNASKTFGTELVLDGNTGFSAAGLQNNETIGSVTLTSAGSLVSAEQGTHDIIASDAIDGTFNSNNYVISYVKGTLTVSAKSINPEVSTDILVEEIASVTYNGLNQDLKPVIKDGDKTLDEETDYELSYSTDTKNVGKVTVAIAGIGNYSGTTTTTYNITPATLTITATPASKTFGTELIFDGTKGFIAVGLQNTETVGSVTLTSAGSLVSAEQGTHDIIASNATGGTFNSNNYAISYVKGTLTVSAKSISPDASADISVEKIADATYNGLNQDLKPVIEDGGKTLVEGTDYTLSYSEDTKNVGEVTVTITGKGNYSGTTTTTYNITPATLTITATPASKAFGTELIFDGTKGFTAVGLQNNETIGSVTLTSAGSLVSAKQGTHDIIASNATGGTFNSNNYAISYVKGTLTVSAKSISPDASADISVEKITSATYNGLNQDLKPVIKDGGKILVEGTDYELSYSEDTKNVGEVTVTITGKGNYSGTTTTTYNITPATLTITATNASKTFGTELVLDGNTGFTAVGLQNNETIGSVTLTSDGSDVNAGAGIYDILTSDAIDGTFNPNNYKLVYESGKLEVNSKGVIGLSVNKIEDVIYNGLNQKLKPVIKDGDKTLDEETDYELSYSTDTKNVGKVTVAIAGIGNYYSENPRTIIYNIKPRVVNIISEGDTKEYDGEVLINNSYKTENFVNGEGLESVEITGGQIYVGESNNTIGNIKFNENTTSSNYIINRDEGKLIVTKSTRVVKVRSIGDEKIYDGGPLVNKKYEIDGLYEKDSANVNITGTQTNYGESPNTIHTVEIKNENTIVNNCYAKIVYEEGTLKVEKRKIVIKSASDEKFYDGTPLKNTGYSIIEGELLKEHHLHVNILSTLTRVGEIGNAIDHASVFDGSHAELSSLGRTGDVDNNDLTVNYEIEVRSGTLKVNKVEIEIKAASANKPYDGQELIDNSYELVGSFAENEGLESVKIEGSQTDIGVSDNLVVEYILKFGTDLANYNIIVSSGTLTVTKNEALKIKITAGTESKVYDGTPLRCEEYTIDGLEIIENVITSTGDSISVKTLGTITNYASGGVENKINVTIVNSSNEDVTKNYDITKNNGKLTIEKAEIKITAGSLTKEYDGLDLSDNSYTLEGSFALNEGFEYVTIFGTWKDVGQYVNRVEGHSFNSLTKSDNYKIISENGRLEITKRKISKDDLVVTASDKVYNGNIATTGTITSNKIVKKDGVSIIGNFNFKDKNADIDKDVDVTDIAFFGSLAGNYELVSGAKSYVTKAKITPKPLSITANNQTKVYGKLIEPTGTEFSSIGLISGEVIASVTLQSTGFAADALAQSAKYQIVASNVVGGNNFLINNYNISYKAGTLTVSAKSISPDAGADISVEKIDNVTYNGLEQKLKPVIKDGKKILVEGTDYTLSHSEDTKNVGEVTVTIIGKGNYNGTTTTIYTIIPAELRIVADDKEKTVGETFEFESDLDFTDYGLQNDETIGSVTLTSDGAAITASPNTYEIVISNATGGSFKITNYKVVYVSGLLTVNAKNINPDINAKITVYPLVDVVYNGSEQKLKPVVKESGNVLEEDKDYQITYSEDITNVGEITVTIIGKGSYAGDLILTYKIKPAEVIVTYSDLKRHIGAANTEIFTNITPTFAGFFNSDSAITEGFNNLKVIVDLHEINLDKNNYDEYATVGIFSNVLSTEYVSNNYTFKISEIGNAVEVINSKAIFGDFSEIEKIKTETVWIKVTEDETNLTIDGQIYNTTESDTTDKNIIKVKKLFVNTLISDLFSFELQESGGVKVKTKGNITEAEITGLKSLLGKRFKYEIELWDLESQSDFAHGKSSISKDLLELDILIGNVTADGDIVDLDRLKQDLLDDGIRNIEDENLTFYKEIIEWDENLDFIQQDKFLLQELVNNANEGKWSHISKVITGWNLISSPLEGTNLWSCNDGAILGDIWNYDRENSVYNSLKKDSEFEMIPGVGYWVVSTADKAIIMSGIRTQNAVVGGPDGVKTGWNLIGPVHNYGQLPEIDLDRYIWEEILYSWEAIDDELNNDDLNNDRNYAYTEAIKVKLAKGYFGFMIDDFSDITIGEIWATQTAVRVAISPTKLTADKDITGVIINLFDLSANKMHFYKKYIALSGQPLETISFAKTNDGRYRVTVGSLPIYYNSNYQLDIQVVFGNTASANKKQVFFKTYTESEQKLITKFVEKNQLDEQIKIDKNFGNDDGNRFYPPNLSQVSGGISINFQAPKNSISYEYSLAVYDANWKLIKRFSGSEKIESNPVILVKKLALSKSYIVSFTVRYKSDKNVYSEYKTYEWNMKNGIIEAKK